MIWNNQTAFFQIQVLGASGTELPTGQGDMILPKDVISLNVSEEFHQQATGSLSLRDPKNIYSRILRKGTVINISFGYKAPSQKLDFLNPGFDVVNSGIVRRGLQAFITSPSGGGSESGELTYNSSFLMFSTRGPKKHESFESGTKSECVRQVMAKIGILTPEINFHRGQDVINTETPERQYESDFRTLARWAGEWGAVFRIGYSSDGTLLGVFIDPERIKDSPGIAAMSQVGINATDLWYRAGVAPNVQSFNWQCQDGNSGQGDGTIIYLVNGKPSFQHYHVADESVTAWKLNPEKVQKALEAAGLKGGPEAEREYVYSIVNASSFNEEKIKDLFDAIEAKTAPNGIGYSMTGRMIGTPYLTPGMTAKFNGSFPDCFTNANSSNTVFFYFQKVTHTLSSSGYFTDFEIVDTYSQSPVSGANLLAAGG